MRKLPNWVLTNPLSAFYDSESGTVIEQTAKVYGAMNTLIEEHNKFIEELNKTIENIESDNAEFKECITELVNNYIKVIDEKVKLQDLAIETKTKEYSKQVIKQAIEDGKIIIKNEYEDGTENLNLSLEYKE